MTIANEFLRVEAARNKIRSWGIGLGIFISTDNFPSMATKLESAIIDRGAVQAQVEVGQTYTIQQGYHNGSGTVAGVAGEGQYDLQAKSVTPSKSQQTITPDSGYFGMSSVIVYAIPSQYQDVTPVTAVAADVLATKVFVSAAGITTTGTMANNGAISGKIDGFLVTEYTIPAGYHSGAGKVSLTDDIETRLAAL